MPSGARPISSLANPLIKAVRALHEKKGRLDACSFLIEGRRELDIALSHRIKLRQIFYCPDIWPEARDYPGDKLAVSLPLLEKISYRGGTEGFVAVARIPEKNLTDWSVPPEPLIVVLDKLEKPGNIGAVLRTAEAAGVDAALICDSSGDLYNPNLIRSSLGAVFSLPVFCLTAVQAAAWLSRHNIAVAAASPRARDTYWQHDWTGARALVIGSEKDGLSGVWAGYTEVLIPMSGEVDSLNASVSAALLIYEAARQRRQP